MSSLLPSIRKRAFSLSKTTLFESKRYLSWNAGKYRKEVLVLQALPSDSEYQNDFEARRWILLESYRDSTPGARTMIF